MISGFFSIIRSGNLLLIILTQLLAVESFSGIGTAISSSVFWSLSLATVLTAAAGYIINDMEDVAADRINKPNKVVVGEIIPMHFAMYSYIGLNFIAIILAIYAGRTATLAVATCIIMLWLYAAHFKKTWVLGNILVASLSAFVLLIYPWCHEVGYDPLYERYALFAFAVSLVREIIKDAEDIPGDKYAHYRTMPVRSGLPFAKKLITALCFLTIILVIMHLSEDDFSSRFHYHWLKWVYLAHMLVLVIAPLAFLAMTTVKAEKKKDFSRMSMYCKLVMLTGLLSVLYFWV